MATQFPTSLDTLANFGRLTNNFSTQLNGAIGSGDTSIAVDDALPILSGGFYVTIESEIIFCSGKSGNNLTVVTRGALGTTAAAHADNTAVNMYVVNGNINDILDVLILLETAIGKTPSPDLGSLRYQAVEIADSALNGGVSAVGGNATFIIDKGTANATGPWVMPFNGKVTGISIGNNGARTAGTCQAQFLINGVAQTGAGQFAQIDATNTQYHYVALATPVNFNAGDRLDAQTVTASFTPTGTDATVTVFWKRR